MHKLEVIVTSPAEAAVAERAGADRLELVRELDAGGLTPRIPHRRSGHQSASRIPVRVMLRENASMSIANDDELADLPTLAAKLQGLPIDGLVMGWVTSTGALDVASLERVLAEAPACRITFHRAFEHLADPIASLKMLKRFPQIDHILTGGGSGSWPERKSRLRVWSDAAAPEIQILVGGGLSDQEVADLMADPQFPEIHVGRAARTPPENNGALDRPKNRAAQAETASTVKPLDWLVFLLWLVSLVSYGLYRGRGSNTVSQYLLAGKSMPWYAMGLSILATQASAITFISTTGQGHVDGMRFAQFYFGLPLAMVILSATAVPIFHRAKVYTAYEYLEHRFDSKTRALTSGIFLIQRGLAAGIGLYAPAVALSAVLGWSDRWITVAIGALVVLYVSTGGIKALTWADVQQMTMIFIALVVSLVVALRALPAQISFLNALHLAGAAGRLNVVDTHFDLSNRYNIWSGLIGGAFLALAYFGCDQSQVQRYLTGKSIAQSRLSLIFNASVKIPMQLFILFIGAMVFVLSLFVQEPVIFHPIEAARAAKTAQWPATESGYDQAFAARRAAAYNLVKHQTPETLAQFQEAQKNFDTERRAARGIVEKLNGGTHFDDTNYIFLTFIKRYLPVGLIGLLIGVIFSASMGSTSGEINSLATVSVVDIYGRYVAPNRDDRHYLLASRVLTVFWGAFAVAFAALGARGFGALIERVNIVGSLFYGGMLGVFVLAFFFKRVQGTAAFWGVIAGELAIFGAARFTDISFLWYNVIGCVVVVSTALLLSALPPKPQSPLQPN